MSAAITSAPNIFIVKTVIEQLHDRLKDEGISEELIKHVADRLGHDRRYGIDPTKIKNDLGWYPETPFEKGIVHDHRLVSGARRLDGPRDQRRLPEILRADVYRISKHTQPSPLQRM